MLRAELEKNLKRFVGHFLNVRLPGVHAASDRLPVHFPQASSNPALQLILHFGLPANPINFCLQESPKVLNWASLGDNGGFHSGAARTGSQAHFPQPGSLPLLLSWICIRGLLALVVLHASFLQYMMHIRLADVELPGPKSAVTHQRGRTPVSPAGSCLLWGSFSGSRHFHFSFEVSHQSQTFPKSKTLFSWKLPNSQNVSQQQISQSLLLTCQNCPMAFLLSVSFMPSILLAPCAFSENKIAPGSSDDGG